MERIIASGKRKRAVARATIKSGEGKIIINKKSYEILPLFDRLKLQEPLRITEHVIGKPKFDVEIIVRGGGSRGQVEAARVALSKAILMFSKEEKLRKAFVEYDRNLLVADVRRKEAYKPGDSKARSKRQKSFR